MGFLLGVRPATDPDQVIAVTTIVSRQQSIGQVGLVGALWGAGHTITIFPVGVAIILFNLAIPTRIGLAMELAVGLMLILLGVLNLTGVTQWVTHRFTPVHNHAEAGIVHSHVHEHEGTFHDHVHSHSPEIQRTLCPIPEKWREIAASVNSQEGFMSAFLDGPLTAELRDMLNTLATACFAPTRQATSLIFSCRSPKLNPDQTYVACF